MCKSRLTRSLRSRREPGFRPSLGLRPRYRFVRIAVLAVACFALALSACRKAPKSSEERGAGIFARTCASCHGPTGRPARGLALPVMPRDLSDASFYQQRSDAELEVAIRDGKGAMPAFGTLLSDEDLKLVIAHLHTLAKAK